MNCLKTDATIGMILSHCCDALVTVASKAGGNSSAHAEGFGAASVGVRDLPLTVTGRALDGINFAICLHWLLHDWVSCSTAGRARVLFDLRCHIEPFMRPDRLALRNSLRLTASAKRPR